MEMELWWIVAACAALGFYLACGIRIVRPTRAALIERLGQFRRVKHQGVTWILPLVEKAYQVNLTEQIADLKPQEVITKDNLNATVDMQVYYKVKNTDEDIKASQYNVNDYEYQIVALARTTMRNVIGNKPFVEVNSQRNDLNKMLMETMQRETEKWGIDIVRCELKEIFPPADVQETMNKVMKASNEKTAAIDFATAKETTADGTKRAFIKEAEGARQAAILNAEGSRQAKILNAEGDAKAIEMVNTAAEKYFTGNAQKLKAMEVTENSLVKNSKVILTGKGINPVLLLGDLTKQSDG